MTTAIAGRPSCSLRLQSMQRALAHASSVERAAVLSSGAAARIVGCDRTTITRAIHAGELEAVRLGRRGHFRIRRTALDQWAQPVTTDHEEA